MNMYLHELKALRKSTIIWTCTLVAFVALFMAMYPSFASSAADFKKILEGYPPAVMKAFGVSLDTITSTLGFYSYIFSYIAICGAIQAMNIGLGVLSKEVRDKTADFLLTKPVMRHQIVTAKLLSALTLLVITDIIYIIAAKIIVSLVANSAYSNKIFFMISITLCFIQLIFLALGVIISVCVTKIKSVIPISLSTVFGFYFISMFGSLLGDKNVSYLTPFKYFEPSYILSHSCYDASYIIVAIIFIILAISSSYVIYIKKDIHAV